MIDKAIKINTYKVSARGLRGRCISLPITWADDLDVQIGDKIDIYRDHAGRLIIVPVPKNDHP